MQKALFTLKIDPDLLARAKEQAQREERTVSSLLRFSLLEYLAKKTGKEQAA